MTWFPKGPETVVTPRRRAYSRLSQRNEAGSQCLVEGIAVHPADVNLLAVVVRRIGGSSAFRTFDGGRSWEPIADAITRDDAQADLTCVALHPARRDVVYLGGGRSRRVYVLRDGLPATSATLAGRVRQIVVDRASVDLDRTILYAATSTGVAMSRDGGRSATWSEVALGDVRSLAVYQPRSGARRFYAGVLDRGLITATSALGPWIDHFGRAGNGLPPSTAPPGYAHAVYVDISPRQPDRVYVAVFDAARPPSNGTANPRFFVSTSPFPHDRWEQRGTRGPFADSLLDGVQLVVAPENGGPDTADVLLFTEGILIERSLDGGRTWEYARQPHLHHVDTRAFAYWPVATAYYPDTLPIGPPPPRATVFVGSDGGLAASTGYTDPAYVLAAEDPDGLVNYNEGPTYLLFSGEPRSLNHGLAALAIHRYTSNPSPLDGGPMSVLGYASTLDTGFPRHLGSAAWAIDHGSAEGGPIIARPVADGVRVWTTGSFRDSWQGWPMETWLDTDGRRFDPSTTVRLADGSTVRPTSRFLPMAAGSVAVGTISQRAADRTRSAFVARVDATGLATPISQTWAPDRERRVYLIAQAGDTLVAATIDQRLWRLDGAAAAGPTSVWTEVTELPAGLTPPSMPDDIFAISASYFASAPEWRGPSPMIAAMTADRAGTFYVLLTDAVGGTPLLRVDGAMVVPEVCGLPLAAVIPTGVVVGETIAHPTEARVLFTSRNGKVFRLAWTQAGWTWTDLSENLPGPEVHDLWIGNIAPAGVAPHFVLRAATAVRGVWERSADASAGAPESLVYFRDHAFDPGWLRPSADGVANPLRVGERAWHWQSPDIKVDTPVLAGGSRYYQNDPEAPAPTSADFAWMRDDSTDAAAGERARAWVQVHNRGFPRSPLRLQIWAITCRVSAVVPALPARGTESFWTRFRPDGTIDTSGVGGGWISLGVRPVDGVDAASSKVVGFTFDTGSNADHRCIAAFVHGPGALLRSDGFSERLDECVPRSSQVAQRNVDVGPPLAWRPAWLRSPPWSTTGPGGIRGREVRRLVAFNNPRAEAAVATLELDLTTLPPEIGLWLRLSRDCRPASITGASRVRTSGVGVLIEAISSALRALLGRPDVPMAAPTWRAASGGWTILHDVPIPAGSAVFVEVVFRAVAKLPSGRRYSVDLLQRIKNEIAGGVTIVLRTAGAPPETPRHLDDDERKIAGEVSRRLTA